MWVSIIQNHSTVHTVKCMKLFSFGFPQKHLHFLAGYLPTDSSRKASFFAIDRTESFISVDMENLILFL